MDFIERKTETLEKTEPVRAFLIKSAVRELYAYLSCVKENDKGTNFLKIRKDIKDVTADPGLAFE